MPPRDTVLHFRTTTDEPLDIAASTIELIGMMNGYPYVRTKSGFSHLLIGDASELRRRWQDALNNCTVIDTTSEEPRTPRRLKP